MSAPTESDFNFLLCCLKHSPGKPDFHAIAAELGLSKYMTAVRTQHDNSHTTLD